MTDEEPGKQQQAVAAVLSWWNDLFPREADATRRRRDGNAAARARLRRCHTVVDALMQADTQPLLRAVRATGYRFPGIEDRLALLAATLARIAPGKPSNDRFAKVLGETSAGKAPQNDERPRLSALRFGALMRALDAVDDPDRALRALRRALPMLDDVPFDVGAFVRDLLTLSDETRRRWVLDYWQSDWRLSDATARPAATTDTPDD